MAPGQARGWAEPRVLHGVSLEPLGEVTDLPGWQQVAGWVPGSDPTSGTGQAGLCETPGAEAADGWCGVGSGLHGEE